VTPRIPEWAHQLARAPSDLCVYWMDSDAAMGDETAEPFIQLDGGALRVAMGAVLFNFRFDLDERDHRKIKRLCGPADPISKTWLPATRSGREVFEQSGVDQPAAQG
jgi:hypothetical protein